MKRSRRTALRVITLGLVPIVALGAGVAYTAGYTSAGTVPEPDLSDGGAVIAAASADQYVTGSSTGFKKAPDETLTRKAVTTTGRGLNYVSYARAYKSLPVFVGGDVVVVTDLAGKVRSSTAGLVPISVPTKAQVSAEQAKTAALRGRDGTVTGKPSLGVIAEAAGRLVWEVIVKGDDSREHVFVDALTGKNAGSWDEVAAGTGKGHYAGTVQIGTTGSGGAFEMRDPSRGNMRTLNDRTGQVFTDTDDSWGNGVGNDPATGAVDTQYAGAAMWDMLKAKFNRNGIDGQGRTATMFVGLNQVNAFYSCAGNGDASRDQTKYGRTSDSARQVNSVDVVAHELGHGVLDRKSVV